MTTGNRQVRSWAAGQPPLRWSMTTLALFVMMYAATSLPLPTRAVALVPAIVAFVVTVRELLRQHRDDAPVRMRLGPSVTLVLLGFVLLIAVGQVVLYDSQKGYEDCISGANTQAAHAQCVLERQQGMFGQ
ncbi:MAG: hypothetical protein ABI083_17510 [Lapillicoccus sp.]